MTERNQINRRLELGGVKKIYFIGVGGVHMSALAELCAASGYTVAGSDAVSSRFTDRLINQGIKVHIGHDAGHLDKTIDLAVRTSAAKDDNPEVIKARELGIRLIDRAALLGVTAASYGHSVCVSGTHGKTTTTSMIGTILQLCGQDPTVINGGECANLGGTLRIGGSSVFVTEADEYYDAFLQLHPYVGVILNIEKDHTDYFPTFERLCQSFKAFASHINSKGVLVAHAGIEGLDKLTEGLNCHVTTYGNGGFWQASEITYGKGGCPSFDVTFAGKRLGRAELSVPGLHNVDNALAAFAACAFLDIGFSAMANALTAFRGADRRLQYKGDFDGVSVIDDYAHHPTEVKASLGALKAGLAANTELWCVFQPHTRSRTEEFMEAFAVSFGDADHLILVDIFTPSGREEGHINVSSGDLAARVRDRGQDAAAAGSFMEAADLLRSRCKPGDTAVVMGAGDVYKITEMLLKK